MSNTRKNKDRAADALPHVVAFSRATGNTHEQINIQIGDLIADLLHLATENGCEVQEILDKAVYDFEEECREEGEVAHHLTTMVAFDTTSRLLTRLKECETVASSLPLPVRTEYKEYDLLIGGIKVSTFEGGGSITSDLKVGSEDCPIWCAAVDGVESIVLALACAGYDISAPGMAEAIATAVDAISNNLGDADELEVDR